jgi:3-deoxy-manno-octulosonate cytidylyltransferase (CMP-KDO synthetase)
MSKPKSIGIIPARYGSERFPGKPLALIQGKSLLQRTYENASKCAGLDRIVIATDDERILQHAYEFGAEAVLTSPHCPTGTDRLAEAYESHAHLASDIIVNIQGDEPCMPITTIDRVIALLHAHPEAAMATAATPIGSADEALSPHVVKCVFDSQGHALYFSRALIPSNKLNTYDATQTYYKHLGIYAYRPEFLKVYAKLPKTSLQVSEDLEQLKVLEHGFQIMVALADGDSHGVDTPQDIFNIEKLLCK